ncbi:hypothetical protein IWX90DRAFT_486093 [Phyllosticta citrichinensis]|uniref:Uncharacterized protein n=1 Tax=Phyllosticta citrichinensis TaxID=1130410 RepID=A0ABR1XXT4_9PEZI
MPTLFGAMTGYINKSTLQRLVALPTEVTPIRMMTKRSSAQMKRASSSVPRLQISRRHIQNSQCLPDTDNPGHQWGFSALLSSVVLIVQLIWGCTIGTVCAAPLLLRLQPKQQRAWRHQN